MAGLAEIQATTWEHREKKPSDLVLDNNPLTYMLKQKGRVKIVNGGRVIYEAARIAQNQYVQRIDASEQFSVSNQ